jgi:hypothetical protein
MMDEGPLGGGGFLLQLAVVAFFSLFLGMTCEAARHRSARLAVDVPLAPESFRLGPREQDAPSTLLSW